MPTLVGLAGKAAPVSNTTIRDTNTLNMVLVTIQLPLLLRAEHSRSMLGRRLFLIAEAKNRAGVDAGGLVESINGKRALERVGLRARPVGDGRNANFIEYVYVAPH